MKSLLVGVLWGALLSSTAMSQESTPGLDGPHRPVTDSLLDNLAGNWKVTRTMRRATSESAVRAEWVLNHQFLMLHYRDDQQAKSQSGYEAMVFVGYDNASDRYVVHWLDRFGGRWSETLGYGTRDGNAIKLVFEYPDGPFHNTYTFDPSTKTWTSLMRQKNARGEWTTFSTDKLSREPPPSLLPPPSFLLPLPPMPHIDVSWPAILVAALAKFVLGWLWFSPILFMKQWKTLSGVTEESMKHGMGTAIAIWVLGSVLTSFILWHFIHWVGGTGAWRGVGVAFHAWVGFVLIAMLDDYAAEKRPFALIAIKAGNQLIGLCVMGAILGAWQ